MDTKEELGLIKMWFDDIRELATTRRNANGFYLSAERVLEHIALNAKDASEYVSLLLKED